MRRSKRLVYAAPALVLVLALGGLLIWSPYGPQEGFPYRLIKESVDAEAPCGAVHEYLGNSANASTWSVFVDHITPLNTHSFPDGERGSIRRSFRHADEEGIAWDEHFELVEPLRRRLSVYNIVGLPSPAGDLLTEQIYEPLPTGCRLSFTLFFREGPSVRDELLMRLFAHWIARIFRANIGNVGRLVETG